MSLEEQEKVNKGEQQKLYAEFLRKQVEFKKKLGNDRGMSESEKRLNRSVLLGVSLNQPGPSLNANDPRPRAQPRHQPTPQKTQ